MTKKYLYHFLKPLATIGLLFFSLLSHAQEAEKSIKRDFIMPLMRLEASPRSGKIDVNPPWFYWSPVVKNKKGNDTYQFDDQYIYQGRVSQDPHFKDATTITSDERAWCLFNPHQKLKPGKWYWQYATIHKSTRKQAWSEPISFEVSGVEREFIIPPFEQIKANIGQDHPRIYCSKEQIGNLNFPAEGVEKFLNKAYKQLNASLPASLLYNNTEILKKKEKQLQPKDLQRFIGKRTKEIYRTQARAFDNILKAYLITGDSKFREEALRRYLYLKNQYHKIVDTGAYNDFTEGFFIAISTQTFDVFYDDLAYEERQEIMNRLIKTQQNSYHHILHNGEHFSIDNHLWQHHFRHFFTTSLALINHVPEADTWAKYVYEVWSMRAPVGSRNDGAWVPDNGYFSANKESLITFPVILGRLTGVNYFNQPWYQNSPTYLSYTSPIGHLAGGFGDNADVTRQNNLDFVRALSAITQNSYGKLYSDQAMRAKQQAPKQPQQALSLWEDGNLYWYMMQAIDTQQKPIAAIAEPERAKCFRDAGMVTMHSNFRNSKKNLMVSFRSSPYGLTGHSHACQNAFNIQYKGEPLFFKTGYYSSFIDPHATLSYRHSRAHNTILADGIGQTFTPSSYGWIARFMTGKHISYALGDASQAYSGQLLRDYFVEQFDKWNIDTTAANGFGKPGVKRFRRHITLLEDDLIVIYDELEADKPVKWSWLLHSRDTLSNKQHTFYTENKEGKGACWLYNQNDLYSAVTDTFFSPAKDWLGNGAKRGIVYKNHWHGESKTSKLSKTRFLAIIQVSPMKEKLQTPKIKSNGTITIKGWTIQAELNGDNQPELVIKKERLGCISYGYTDVVFDKQTYTRKTPGSTILIEKSHTGILHEETIDQLPDAGIYY